MSIRRLTVLAATLTAATTLALSAAAQCPCTPPSHAGFTVVGHR